MTSTTEFIATFPCTVADVEEPIEDQPVGVILEGPTDPPGPAGQQLLDAIYPEGWHETIESMTVRMRVHQNYMPEIGDKIPVSVRLVKRG